MFDQDGKGHISLADLQSILYSAFAMPPDEVKKFFEKIDAKHDGLITFGINISLFVNSGGLLICIVCL